MKSFFFIVVDPVQNQETNKFYILSPATFYDCINTIYQFINISLIKMSIFEEYGVLNIVYINLYFLGPL